jgi:hypothetical protein
MARSHKRILSPSQRIKMKKTSRKKSSRKKSNKKSNKKSSRKTSRKKKQKKVKRHLEEAYSPYVIQKSRHRRSYLTKDISETINKISSRDHNLRQFYRLPKQTCEKHKYNPEKCRLDPKCRLTSRGCEYY